MMIREASHYGTENLMESRSEKVEQPQDSSTWWRHGSGYLVLIARAGGQFSGLLAAISLYRTNLTLRKFERRKIVE
jgi:hypothetical protein